MPFTPSQFSSDAVITAATKLAQYQVEINKLMDDMEAYMSTVSTALSAYHATNTGYSATVLDQYFLGARAQALITGGGAISVSATYEVSWSQRFIVIANGNGASLATSGFFDITVPANGTVITGVGGATNKTATAAGIPLAPWESLYYILPMGSTNTSVPANFRVVYHTSALTIPPTWIKIAQRHDGAEGLYVEFANKVSLKAGKSINTGLYDVLGEDVSGAVASANTLATARTINGVSFNGSANINIEDRLGTAIASAATTTVGTAGLGDYIHITGTTTITSFGTAASAGIRRTLIFDGALTITHNATSLICVGAANIVTVAGTIIEIVAETTANWRVLSVTHPNLSFGELSHLDGLSSNVQTQINGKLSTGGGTLTGALTLSGDPTADLHAVPRRWVQGRPAKDSARVATTANLTATATATTLTNSGTLAALVIDGITLAAGERVLVRNQTAAAQNGIYEVTNIGSASVAWVLTRSAGGDTWNDLVSAMISVDDGATNANKTYFCVQNIGGTLGTSDLNFEVMAEPITGSTRQLLAASGFQKIAGGLIMQWGVVNIAANGTAAPTLPMTFPTAIVFAIAQNRENSADAQPAQVYAQTTSSVSIVNGSGAAQDCYYFALGY